MAVRSRCRCPTAAELAVLWMATAGLLLANISCVRSFGGGIQPPQRHDNHISRRDVVVMTTTTTWMGLLMAGGPRSAAAATATSVATATDDANLMINTWLRQLENIPVFCIVDKTTGANYMLVKQEERMAVGYAFCTYDGASIVLAEAQKTAREKNYYDVWQDATITTIPMSIAVRLALKKRIRTTPKEQTLDSIVLMIPGAVGNLLLRMMMRILYMSLSSFVAEVTSSSFVPRRRLLLLQNLETNRTNNSTEWPSTIVSKTKVGFRSFTFLNHHHYHPTTTIIMPHHPPPCDSFLAARTC
jgi:hypothetical protein